ncbi:hypothetical protein GCM10023100_55200 [Actinocorallia cavernae]|uniref:Uncharacterized protein n=2 Tax=Actinomycetes TaxID=1760 RepID=A0ABN3L429_9ACTN
MGACSGVRAVDSPQTASLEAPGILESIVRRVSVCVLCMGVRGWRSTPPVFIALAFRISTSQVLAGRLLCGRCLCLARTGAPDYFGAVKFAVEVRAGIDLGIGLERGAWDLADGARA